MKIAITDACIFIDLHDLNLTIPFFSLNLEIHTSLDVFYELYPEQQQLLKAFVSVGKLKIHNLIEQDRKEILEAQYPKSLSEMDKTVLHLALKQNALVLSSDKAVRNCAKLKAIDYHGMLWIFDRLIEEKILSKTDSSTKLIELIRLNIIYQNNSKLMSEFKKRLDLWKN